MLAELGHVDLVAMFEFCFLDDLAQGKVQSLTLVIRIAGRRFHDAELLEQMQAVHQSVRILPNLLE